MIDWGFLCFVTMPSIAIDDKYVDNGVPTVDSSVEGFEQFFFQLGALFSATISQSWHTLVSNESQSAAAHDLSAAGPTVALRWSR